MESGPAVVRSRDSIMAKPPPFLLLFFSLHVTGDCIIFAPGKQNPKSAKRSLFGISSGL